MLREEFTQRTGIEVDDEEFERISKIYNECLLSKDTFCAEWKEKSLSDCHIVDDLMSTLARYVKTADMINDGYQKIKVQHYKMLDKMAISTDETLVAYAKNELPISHFISLRVSAGKPLDQDCVEYIVANLK